MKILSPILICLTVVSHAETLELAPADSAVERRTAEALSMLTALDLPRAQLNERSALTLLALVDIKPNTPWAEAGKPLMGITPIMNYLREHYGKDYAPNTRETIRRQTIHQFVEAGIAVSNPDRPDRPVNSPKWCYQITPHTLGLIRAFGTDNWRARLAFYHEHRQTLADRYAMEREMHMIPLTINGGVELSLTPGAHSQLIKEIITEFGPRYAPGSEVLYVGDTGEKMGHFDQAVFQSLGLAFDTHGKMPDVVLFHRARNWLFLIESVTSHGPVDAKRYDELSSLFEKSSAGLVYVTAFPDRPSMAKYVDEISWESEVWVADSPSHLIHFDGTRFLGPYQDRAGD